MFFWPLEKYFKIVKIDPKVYPISLILISFRRTECAICKMLIGQRRIIRFKEE
jgi:hypothetical protein